MSQELTYYSFGIRYPDEPLRRNYSRLVPDSLSNYRYYFALLSIEHFLHCRLAVRTVVFSFDQPIACHLIFFQLVRQGWSLLFFFNIYIFFPLDSDLLHIFIFKSLAGFFYRKGYYFIYIYIYIYRERERGRYYKWFKLIYFLIISIRQENLKL